MSPEEHELLRRSISLAEENNEMLRGIRSSMRLARFMTLVYWVFIIGTALGAYYLVQPYWEQALRTYGVAQSRINEINTTFDSFKSKIGQ